MPQILQIVFAIIGIILLFNFMIFFHELGHFLAARWRGLYVDRFQIWFGKPIWSKTINGVQWGLGWIPAGGFVSLPQMAPMEGVEGKTSAEKELPPIKPIDKIIVAFAGPLFSFILAILFSVIVCFVGKPTVLFNTTTVGFVSPDSPAQKAGILAGDVIRKIDNQPVKTWMGDMEGVSELIKISENPEITFDIDRPQPDGSTKSIKLSSKFEIPETSWWKRAELRQIGIAPASKSLIADVMKNSPAQLAGLQKGDEITHLNGKPIFSYSAIFAESSTGKPMELTVKRGDEQKVFTLTPVKPSNMEKSEPMLGILYSPPETVERSLTYPSPLEQISRSLLWMKLSVQKVIAPGSSVGVEHLSGPVGIVTLLYDLLISPQGILLVIWFSVVLNVNLAVLNLMPLPVVDGGHITFGFIEIILKRPIHPKFLYIIQNGFAIVLFAFFLFVTFKDIGDRVGTNSDENKEPIFSAPAKK